MSKSKTANTHQNSTATPYFSTCIYNEALARSGANIKELNKQLLAEIQTLAEIDEDGIAWSKKNYRHGYTSYASMSQLHLSSPYFADLKKMIDLHVWKFCQMVDFDIHKKQIQMDTCWVNLMPMHTTHSLHLHPLSFISGTYYVSVPKGSGNIKFEDPRLDRFMAAPPRKENAKPSNRAFIEIAPKPGEVVLFESWLRHEVLANTGSSKRASISFNYSWN